MRFFHAFLLVLALSFTTAQHAEAWPKSLMISPILSAATGTGAGTTFGPAPSGEKSFQAVVTGSGSVTATVLIQVSNDPTVQGWLTLGTITLSGTTTATDGFVTSGAWGYYRANVSAVTGTSAAVTVTTAQE